MAKAYWVATYFSVSNPDALAEYAKLAGPAIAAGGGRFLARGTAAKAYEKGLTQRTVIIEFDSVDKAAAAHDSPGYQAALKVLGNAVAARPAHRRRDGVSSSLRGANASPARSGRPRCRLRDEAIQYGGAGLDRFARLAMTTLTR